MRLHPSAPPFWMLLGILCLTFAYYLAGGTRLGQETFLSGAAPPWAFLSLAIACFAAAGVVWLVRRA